MSADVKANEKEEIKRSDSSPENFYKMYIIPSQMSKGCVCVYLSFNFVWYIPCSLWILSIFQNRAGGGGGREPGGRQGVNT